MPITTVTLQPGLLATPVIARRTLAVTAPAVVPDTPPAPTTPLVATPLLVAPLALADGGPRLQALAMPTLRMQHFALRPELAAALARAEDGLPREQVDAPLAASPAPGDEALFESADDPARRWWLPRYRLRERAGQYELGVALGADGRWQLRMGLERYPAPALGDVGAATMLPHALFLELRYLVGPTRSIERRVALTAVTEDAAGGIAASVDLDVQARDSLLLALRDPSAQPRLEATRVARVALPLAAAPPAPTSAPADADPAPAVAFAPDAAVLARPLPLAGLRMADVAAGRGRPLRPRPPKRIPRPDAPAAPATRYRVVEHAFASAAGPEPFAFDAQLHAYVYAGATIAAGHADRPPFQRLTLPHARGGGSPRHHAYFQDRDQPWVFHYLPDRLLPVRAPAPPFLPQMLVRLASEDGSIERALATLDVVLAPEVDPARLAAAALALVAHVPATAGGRAPELRPLQASSRLLLSVPGERGVERRDLGDIGADLANGASLSLTLPMAAFEMAWASLGAGAADSLLTGELRVETGLAQPEVLPVTLRLADALGPLLDVAEAPAAGDGEVGLRLENPTESAVRVDALPVALLREGARVEARLDGLPPLPHVIAPGGSLDLLARPAAPLPGAGPADAELDLRGLRVQPDAAALLPRVTDASVPASYTRTIDVYSPPGMFDGDGPDAFVLANVELQGGARVRLGAALTEATLEIELPLLDLLLDRAGGSRFRWRQQLVRRDGRTVVDAEWREQDFAMVVVQFPAAPGP